MFNYLKSLPWVVSSQRQRFPVTKDFLLPFHIFHCYHMMKVGYIGAVKAARQKWGLSFENLFLLIMSPTFSRCSCTKRIPVLCLFPLRNNDIHTLVCARTLITRGAIRRVIMIELDRKPLPDVSDSYKTMEQSIILRDFDQYMFGTDEQPPSHKSGIFTSQSRARFLTCSSLVDWGIGKRKAYDTLEAISVAMTGLGFHGRAMQKRRTVGQMP